MKLLTTILITVLILIPSFLTIRYIGLDKKTDYNNLPTWGYPLIGSKDFTFDLDDNISVVANYDKNLFRKVPQLNKITPKELRQKTKHLVFLGGSNTFGEALEDSETIAKLAFKKEFSIYYPYIIATPGWGPHNILARIESLILPNIIKQGRGEFIYNFIHDHFNRVCGSHSYLGWNHGVSPHYSFKNNDIKYEGMQKNTLNFEFFLFKHGMIKIKQYLTNNPNIYLELKEPSINCIKKTAYIINRIKKVYLENFPKGKFSLVYLPHTKGARDQLRDLQSLELILKNLKVNTYYSQNEYDLAVSKQKNKDIYLDKTLHFNSKFFSEIYPQVLKRIIE